MSALFEAKKYPQDVGVFLPDFFLKSCFGNFPSEYTTSNGNRQFWLKNRGILGRQFPP
jgi:hypothetical protein